MTDINLYARARTDFSNFMSAYGDTLTVTRVTETTDSMGTVSDVSESTFSITAMIQDISHKDRKIHEMGLAVSGNRKIYMKHTESGGTVKEGDIITDEDSVDWKLVTILKEPTLTGNEVFKTGIIKSISTEGST